MTFHLKVRALYSSSTDNLSQKFERHIECPSEEVAISLAKEIVQEFHDKIALYTEIFSLSAELYIFKSIWKTTLVPAVSVEPARPAVPAEPERSAVPAHFEDEKLS